MKDLNYSLDANYHYSFVIKYQSKCGVVHEQNSNWPIRLDRWAVSGRLSFSADAVTATHEVVFRVGCSAGASYQVASSSVALIRPSPEISGGLGTWDPPSHAGMCCQHALHPTPPPILYLQFYTLLKNKFYFIRLLLTYQQQRSVDHKKNNIS